MGGRAGQYTLVCFWGTRCGPCRWQTPYVKQAYEQLGDRIAFVSVAANDGPERVAQYVEANGLEWPQVIEPSQESGSKRASRTYGVMGYPSLLLIGPDGTIVVGAENASRLRNAALLETLAEFVGES